MNPRTLSTPLLTLAALALSGCAGITDPYQATSRPATASTAAPPSASRSAGPSAATRADAGDPAAERGGTIPPAANAAQQALAVGADEPTPRAALARYASLYINWTAQDLPARQRQLAAISLGQARVQALQAAASGARDPELTRSQVQNHGQLVAIAPGAGPATWVLVTQETTTGQGDYAGLPPTLHVTYAQLAHTTAGWVITTWSPQT